MLLALIQVNKNSEDKHIIDILSTINADIVLLPENWRKGIAQEHDLYKLFSALPEFELLVPGAFYVEREGILASRAYVIKRGELVDYCEKIFPSFAVGEAARVRSGRKLCLQSLGWVKVGVIICVDLAFPELSRLYALRGANLLLNPANISADRAQLWRALARARAFENHAYVGFANNVNGTYADGRPVSGGSAVADPNGDIIAEGDEREGIVLARLDSASVAFARGRRRYLEQISSFNSSEILL